MILSFTVIFDHFSHISPIFTKALRTNQLSHQQTKQQIVQSSIDLYRDARTYQKTFLIDSITNLCFSANLLQKSGNVHLYFVQESLPEAHDSLMESFNRMRMVIEERNAAKEAENEITFGYLHPDTCNASVDI